LTYVSPDDNVHTWTNFLKNYQLPTVQQVAVSDTLGELQIPIGTLLCVLVMLPAGWQVYKRKQQGKTVIGPGVLVILLTSGALFSWTFSPTFAVGRPAAMTSDLDDEQSILLLKTLLKNIYRAFNFREEQDVYDKLALTVSGDLLADIYLQNRQSFAVQKAGGAQARVRTVDVQAATARQVEGKPLAYVINGQWSALGTVGHWGHVHTRKNLYDAIVTVEGVDGNWKITGLELLEEKRVEPSAPLVAGKKQ
jgi:hypothetical protein